jgi:hypothetical protein
MFHKILYNEKFRDCAVLCLQRFTTYVTTVRQHESDYGRSTETGISRMVVKGTDDDVFR